MHSDIVLDIILALLAAGALAFGLWVYAIYYTVKHAPRGKMFLCDKHGMLLADHCIRFLDQPYCPYCYGERKRSLLE